MKNIHYVILTGLLLAVDSVGAGSPKLRVPPLSTTGGDRLPGKFVWADLVTDDVGAARTFYGRLFGWIYEDAGGYTIAKNQDRPLAGFIQHARPAGGQAKPLWFGYLSVTDVGKAQRAVLAAGGTVLAPPQKFPDRGEQAVFRDAEGVLFGVIKSSSGDPADFLADPGDWIWIQLLSRDGRKATEFYQAVGGYEVVENVQTNRLSDYVLMSEGYARGTVRTIRSDDKDVRPLWLPFVRVKDVRESAAKARRLGGRVIIEPKPELFGGKVAMIADPAGAAIGILEWSAESTKGDVEP